MKSGSFETAFNARSSGRVDMKLIWLLVAIPAVYFVLSSSIAHLRGRQLYDDDVLEIRDCRECHGKGHDERYTKDFNGIGMNCMACLGTGKIQVIAPGPNRPTQVWGAVIDFRAGDATIAHQCPEHIRVDFGKTVMLSSNEKVIRGGLAGVRVSFKGEGERVIAKTDGGGRFNCKLLPGTHTVEVEHEGFAKLQSTIEIERLTAPIWLERNTIIRARSNDERTSKDGIALLTLLERPGEGSGMLRRFLMPE